MTDDSPTWDELASSWDSREPVREYAEKAYTSLLGRAQEQLVVSGAKLLDFGAGTGCLTERLAGRARSITAVDTSLEMLAVLDAKKLPGVSTVCADLSSGATPPELVEFAPFDLVVASSVCAFVGDYPALLRVLDGLLAPGGRFVQWDWQQPEGAAPEEMGFPPSQLKAAYETVGWTTEFVGTAFEMLMGDESSPVLMGVAVRP